MGLKINKEVIKSPSGKNFVMLHMISGVHFRFGNAAFLLPVALIFIIYLFSSTYELI